MRYFVVQVEQQYVANRYASSQMTSDVEEAFAYTSHEEAIAAANELQGIVVEQDVSLEELEHIDFDKVELLDESFHFRLDYLA